MNKVVDYYRVLGINMDATQEEVMQALRKVLKENELRGVVEGSREYERRSTVRSEIFKIYGILGDKEKRTKYDAALTRYQAELRKKYTQAYQEDTQKVTRESDYSEAWGGILRKSSSQEVRTDSAVKPNYQASNAACKDASTSGQTSQTRSSRGSSSSSNGVARTQSASVTRTAKTSGSKQTGSKNKQKAQSKGTLRIYHSFMRELLKLRVRRNDTVRKYVLRNRKALGTLVVAGVIGGFVIVKIGDHDSVPYFEPNPSIVSNEDNRVEDPLVLDSTTNPTESTEQFDQLEHLKQQGEAITIYRVHKGVVGDTLSKFSADSNVTIEEIKRLNGMKSDNVMLGKDYMIPYIIAPEDLYIYTNSETYNPNKSLDDYAREYETDVDTICRINSEAVVFEVGKGYRVLTDSLLVPQFVTKEEYRVIKAGERIMERVKSSDNN